jgi:hypothetical protein
MNRSIILPGLVTAFVALSPVGVALADNPHSPSNPTGPATGQPNQSLEAQPSHPPGFDTGAGTGQGATTKGFANAESHYAGSQPQNSNNPKSVSQYDVAAFQLSNNHGHTK